MLPRLVVMVSQSDQVTGWAAALFIPFAVISTKGLATRPVPSRVLRANFARFDTPRGVKAHEQTAWSPTLSGSFHVPHRFGVLVLA